MISQANVIDAGTARRARWIGPLFAGAFVAGVCDITYATTFSYFYRGTPPSRILKLVASGLLGPDAYQGGAGTAALGLGLHFLNAFIITCIFFIAASRIPALVRKPVLVGVIYGIGIYLVMNYVVIPLSRIGPRPTPPAPVWVSGLLVHMFLIGVPMALAARRAFDTR